MFSGIVEEFATVVAIEKEQENEVAAPTQQGVTVAD